MCTNGELHRHSYVVLVVSCSSYGLGLVIVVLILVLDLVIILLPTLERNMIRKAAQCRFRINFRSEIS